MRLLEGIIVPIVIPFNQGSALDLAALRHLASHLVDMGVQGIFPCGSQGEFHVMSLDE